MTVPAASAHLLRPERSAPRAAADQRASAGTEPGAGVGTPDARSSDPAESVGGRWWGRPLHEVRWSLELARLLTDPVFRGEGVPRARERRPVIVMPGLLAGDYTLSVLGAWLWRLGYRPHVCRFVSNTDCSDRAADRVAERVAEVHDRYGMRVALIGHSRGGHYARAVAARMPERVSHAISLGADLRELVRISLPTRIAVAGVRCGLRITGRSRSDECVSLQCDCAFTRDYTRAFPSHLVRLTSIYTREDGVVRWQNQVVPEAECVEVTGSHVGLIFNRQAYRVIAQALSEPERRGGSSGE
jgi:triacylglycerol lipase